MSAVPQRAPVARPAVTTRRPRLLIVRAPAHQRSLVPFVALCLTILVGAMLGALLLNTAMAATAYEMQEQRIELARLSEHQQILTQQVERRGAPGALAAAATELGMERGEGTSYLRLEDGAIAGPAAELVGSD